MAFIDSTIDDLEQEHVGNMLPQIGLDGTAIDEKKKEDPFAGDEEDYFHDPAWDKAQEKKGEPIGKILDRWDKQSNKGKVTTEDADDKTINNDLKSDIPRNVRKAISKMATLEAKIKDAKNLGYEKETIQKLKAELLETKSFINKELKSMSKQEKVDVAKLVKVARQSVTKEDKKNEKNVNESVEFELNQLYNQIKDVEYDKNHLEKVLDKMPNDGSEKRWKIEAERDNLISKLDDLNKEAEKLLRESQKTDKSKKYSSYHGSPFGKRIQKEDKKNEKNINESTGIYEDEICHEISVGKEITVTEAISETVAVVAGMLGLYALLLAPAIIAAIKEARRTFHKIKDSEVPEEYKMPKADIDKLLKEAEMVSKIGKDTFKRLSDSPIAKKDGKAINTLKDYVTLVDKKLEMEYYKNKKKEYLHYLGKIVLKYEAPFNGWSVESKKIQSLVNNILYEMVDEIRSKDLKIQLYFFHNNEREVQTYGSIILYAETRLKKQTDTKLKSANESALIELSDKITDCYFNIQEATDKFNETGENRFELQIKGNTNLMESYQEKLDKVVNEIMLEKADMEKEIAPIVETFNRKGYKVKYASPGHKHLRKKEDQEPDGVFKGKLYSDARVVFEEKYNFPKAPKYWTWKDVDNCSYLDIVEEEYKESDGTPDEAFAKWKTNYMESLREFANSLKDNGSSKEEEVEESVNVMDIMEDLFFELI